MGSQRRFGVAVILAGVTLAASPAFGADPTAHQAETDALNLRQLTATVAKAEADARKAQADANKAQVDASTAENVRKASGLKAVADALPSPTTGAVDVKGDAGKLEASVLATLAANAIAPTLSTNIKAAVDAVKIPPAEAAAKDACKVVPAGAPPPAGEKPSVVILSGTDAAGFSHWETFAIRACQIEYLLNKANGDVAARQNAAGLPLAADAALLAGAAVSAATKLLAILTPNWEVGGVAVSQDDSVLVTAVAHRYLVNTNYPFIWPSRVAKLDASRGVVAAMTVLGRQADQARASLSDLASAKKTLADAKASKADKAKAGAVKAAIGPSEDDLTAATGAYDALAAALRGSDDKTALPLNLVVQEKAMAESLGPYGLVVWLHTQTVAGGYYTRKVIWNVFGGMPFFVTGGVVVSYTVVRPSTWRVVAAGTYACHAGYQRLDAVAAGLKKPAVTCTGD